MTEDQKPERLKFKTLHEALAAARHKPLGTEYVIEGCRFIAVESITGDGSIALATVMRFPGEPGNQAP